MESYVKYSMHGFNRKNKAESNGKQFEFTFSDNEPYVYTDHPFLDRVFINDTITEITFYLQPGKFCEDYEEQIRVELEKICFNLITYSELPILQPLCRLETAINEDGSKVHFNDHMPLRDEVYIFKTSSAKGIYDAGLQHQTNFADCEAVYKEIFWILHSPHKVIQFMGLYDIMAELICSPISQSKVHDYFGKNKNKYPFITFEPSQKDPSKNEDSLTHLRNAIAHSQQIGTQKYLEVSRSISDEHIKRLLRVINDLLCDKAQK